MKSRFILSIVLVCAALGALIYSASQNTAKAVVTVRQLKAGVDARENIRLGARVADSNYDYQTEPGFQLRFNVEDPGVSGDKLPVIYYGMMPDTFTAGRDVILEGGFDGERFHAKSLLTQCPSKYEPPTPG